MKAGMITPSGEVVLPMHHAYPLSVDDDESTMDPIFVDPSDRRQVGRWLARASAVVAAGGAAAAEAGGIPRV